MNTSYIPILKTTMLGMALILGLYWGPAQARDEVCVYDERDWKGDRFCTEDSIRNLADEGWNDDIASIEVDRDMEVVLYEHADYQGRSVRVMEDADHIRHGLDHEVSSLKIVRPGGEDHHHRSKGHESHPHHPAGQGWHLQQYCNCRTHKRCYVKGHEVGECLFNCPQGCKG